MPIYEYQCAKCGEEFELVQSFGADNSELKCPKCGAPNPQRKLSLFASGGSSSESCAPTPSGGG